MFKNIAIVGTSHISRESEKKIEEKINQFKPEIIAIELDKKRYYSLLSKKDSKPSISAVFEVGVMGFLFMIIGRWAQKKTRFDCGG